MTTIWPVSPWRSAFREDCFLPASVLGPVECWAFSRLISALCGEDICLFPFLVCLSHRREWGELRWEREVIEKSGVVGACLRELAAHGLPHFGVGDNVAIVQRRAPPLAGDLAQSRFFYNRRLLEQVIRNPLLRHS